MSSLPTLSIVTISFNQAKFLRGCLDSVCRQKLPGIDYVVVDPGSTDGSREILDEYAKAGLVDTLLLAPDDGPADGLNKGFAAARGDLFAYINSDDLFAKGAFNYVQQYFAAHPDVDVLCGAIRMIDEHGHAALRGRTADLFELRRYATGVCTIGQQATFFRRSIFEKAGRFNVANRIAWDGELLVDMALAGGRFKTTRKVLGDFRIYGESITGSATYLERLEAYNSALWNKLARHGVTPYPRLAEQLIRLAYKVNPLRHAGYLLAR
jgi:glycosyltransferase involved in cell wall biosynthesis